jgi:hypothetical protein
MPEPLAPDAVAEHLATRPDVEWLPESLPVSRDE